jgi:hypothetical protein
MAVGGGHSHSHNGAAAGWGKKDSVDSARAFSQNALSYQYLVQSGVASVIAE